MTDHKTPTMPVYRGRPCRRCNASGIWRGRGICYSCGGSGTERIEVGRRLLTAEEQASFDAYQRGLDARAARAAARKARREARP